MEHRLRLFVGPLTALRPFVQAALSARVLMLAAGSPFPVLPLDDVTHEALHTANGTGDWSDSGPLLTTTDLAFAARASRGSALAYLEIEPAENGLQQCAMLWRDGALVMKAAELGAAQSLTRPAALWPVNTALKGLGIVARPGQDELQALGLNDVGNLAGTLAQAREVAVTR